MTTKSDEEFLFDPQNGSAHPDALYQYPYRNFEIKPDNWQKSNAAGYETHATQLKINRVMVPLRELLQPLVRRAMLSPLRSAGRKVYGTAVSPVVMEASWLFAQRSVIAALASGKVTKEGLWDASDTHKQFVFHGTHPECLIPLLTSGGFTATADARFAEMHLNVAVVHVCESEDDNSWIWSHATKTRLVPRADFQEMRLDGEEMAVCPVTCRAAVEEMCKKHMGTVQFVLKCQPLVDEPVYRRPGVGELAYYADDLRIVAVRCHIGREVQGCYNGDRIAHYGVTGDETILTTAPNNAVDVGSLNRFRFDVPNSMLCALVPRVRSLIFSDKPQEYPIEY